MIFVAVGCTFCRCTGLPDLPCCSGLTAQQSCGFPCQALQLFANFKVEHATNFFVWQNGNSKLLSDEFIILCVLQQARSATLMSTAF